MINWLAELLSLAPRQVWALEQMVDVIGDVATRGFAATMAVLMELFSFFLLGTPLKPFGDELDLTGYEIVFEDEFEGDVDWSVWRPRAEGPSRMGYVSSSQASTKDGSLYLTAEYKEDGAYGEGWYTGDIALREKYTYGYYEVRAICNGDNAFWSAFWLRSEHCYEPEYSLGGPGGAEIDILEALCYPMGYNANKNTIHVAGIDGPDDKGIDSYHMPYFKVDTIYEDYNTYGLMWTEDEYIFYINGVETMRTDFGNGVCEEPMDVILSLCMPAHDNSAFHKGFMELDKSETPQFVVDYVRIYQLAE